ncbi:1427_t:CDS:2 [Gigaspora rosea]|nr:1427_t:CDS:2 [Gigaspora rosea]
MAKLASNGQKSLEISQISQQLNTQTKKATFQLELQNDQQRPFYITKKFELPIE